MPCNRKIIQPEFGFQLEIANEQDTESKISDFKAELIKFAALDVSNEEIPKRYDSQDDD